MGGWPGRIVQLESALRLSSEAFCAGVVVTVPKPFSTFWHTIAHLFQSRLLMFGMLVCVRSTSVTYRSMQ